MAAAATPPGVVDPTKPAKYPVILSDALLGKSSPKEILTALKCGSLSSSFLATQGPFITYRKELIVHAL